MKRSITCPRDLGYHETTGIKTVKSEESKVKSCYTLDGRIATDSMKGIIIQDGKKFK